METGMEIMGAGQTDRMEARTKDMAMEFTTIVAKEFQRKLQIMWKPSKPKSVLCNRSFKCGIS